MPRPRNASSEYLGFGVPRPRNAEVGLKSCMRDVDRTNVEAFCSGMNPRVLAGLVRQPRWNELVTTILQRLWPRIRDYLSGLVRGEDPDRLAPPGFVFTCRAGRHRSVGTYVACLVFFESQSLVSELTAAQWEMLSVMTVRVCGAASAAQH